MKTVLCLVKLCLWWLTSQHINRWSSGNRSYKTECLITPNRIYGSIQRGIISILHEALFTTVHTNCTLSGDIVSIWGGGNLNCFHCIIFLASSIQHFIIFQGFKNLFNSIISIILCCSNDSKSNKHLNK